MDLKKMVSMIVGAVCALAVEAAQYHITTPVTRSGIWSIGGGNITHVEPGGSEVVNKSSGNCYIEILATTAAMPAELWVEGGYVQSEVLALRGEYSTCRVYSGLMTLTGGGFLFDGGASVGGRVWLIGGTCEAAVNFRKCAIAELRMGGGRLISPTLGGDNMDKAKIYFDLTNTAYAVTGNYRTSDRYAIKATTPITQAPKSLTITGTPVSGCAYGLVDGLADDTFFASTEVTLPAGWELVYKDSKLLLVESAPRAVKRATWTGAADDGNPRTPGNWICHACDGTVIENAIPGWDALAIVPAGTTNFTFPRDKAVVVNELRFQDDEYTLAETTDWQGLDFDLVTRAPARIDVNGHVLKVSSEPSATMRTSDLTQPGGNVRTTFYGNSALSSGSPAGLVDDLVDNSHRFLSGNFQGCAIDYDFGAGSETIVRGVRFYCPGTSQRRPKALTISGTMADPTLATETDWNLLYTGDNLNLKYNGWTDFLSFDNDTPYRAYRIKITANMGTDGYGTYLEFYEMEFALEARSSTTEVTSGVADGELCFDVPVDRYVEIAKTAISGPIKVIKEGDGSLGFKKTNQTFTGGVEAMAGSLRTQGTPGSWIYGGASTEKQDATTITLHEGSTLDLWGYTGWGYTTIVLDGGMVTGRTAQFNPRLRLTAPSTIKPTGDFTVPNGADWSDLGGQTLTLAIPSGTQFTLNQSAISNGVIDVTSGGWFVNQTELDARTVDLKMSAAMRISAPLAVHDHVARRDSNYNEGDAELAVYGTLVPETDFYRGCTMQDGSAIDLSARTNEWSTTSAFTVGPNLVTCADGATVTIALGARRPVRGERIVFWRDAPANLASLKFAFSLNDGTVVPEPAYVTPTGVFYGCEPSVVDRGYWTGAVDNDVLKPANWVCTNAANEGLSGVVPGTVSAIHLGGNCAMNAPEASGFGCTWVVFDAPVVLTADCDWRALDLARIHDDSVIDLNGHKLFVKGFNGTTARTLTITDSSAGEPGEFHVDVPEGMNCSVSTIAIEGNTRLVKEGAGTFFMARAHQPYTGGTEIAEGPLRTEADPMDWPFGGDGILDPSAMTITVREGAQLYLAGKQHWANATVILAGGAIQGQTASFNPQIVVVENSGITVSSGNLTLPAETGLCDLGGHTLTIAIESGKNISFNQSTLANGKLDFVSGGWFYSQVALDARTVDIRVGCALGILADLTVRDYETVYGANYNQGTNVMTVCGTFLPTTDYFYGCVLADGAAIDLSARTNAWSTTSLFTGSGNRVVNFAPGARIGVKLGERELEDGDQIIAWTEETAPENASALKFKPIGHNGTLYVRDDGVYFRASGLTIFVR